MTRKSVLERFTDAYIPEPNTGCWLWIKSGSANGYGTIRANKSQWRAHRLSYALFVGEIPEGALVLHKCDVRCCVNPDHLWLGSHRDNTHDMVRKGRHPSTKKTHCPKGHPYSGHNLLNLGNQRRCRACVNEYNRSRRVGAPEMIAYRNKREARRKKLTDARDKLK